MATSQLDIPTPVSDDQLVLVISVDDTWLHAGTVREVLDHAEEHRQQAPAPLTEKVLEFFGGGGQRLVPLVDGRLVVCGFVTGGGQLDQVALLRRIDAVLDRAQAHLDLHPGGAGAGQSVPRPVGDLSHVLASLRDSLDEPVHQDHSAGWFHNLLHALG